MTEALRAMVQYGFERKGLDVLAIGHFKENSRSRRVIEKCGFHYEGTLSQAFQRFDGKVFDDVCYSILREDYFPARSGTKIPEEKGGSHPHGAHQLRPPQTSRKKRERKGKQWVRFP